MVLHVGRDVLVMRMCGFEDGVAGMRLRIVAAKLFILAPEFVSIPVDRRWKAVEEKTFTNGDAVAVVEEQFTRNATERGLEAGRTRGSIAGWTGNAQPACR